MKITYCFIFCVAVLYACRKGCGMPRYKFFFEQKQSYFLIKGFDFKHYLKNFLPQCRGPVQKVLTNFPDIRQMKV